MSETVRAPTVPPTVPTPRKVAVLGAGSWGTAFAKIAADAARVDADSNPSWKVVLWGRDEAAMNLMAETGTNDRYFPNVRLPGNLEFTANQREALTGADVVVLALPAQVLRDQLVSVSDAVPEEAV